MLTPLFLTLAGCTSDPTTTEAALTGSADFDACAGLDLELAESEAELAALDAIVFGRLVAGLNFAELERAALRAANPALLREERIALDSEVHQRLAEAERFGATDEAIAPAAFGIDEVDVSRPGGALRALAGFRGAVDGAGAAYAAGVGEYDAAAAERVAVFVAFPECGHEVAGTYPLELGFEAHGPARYAGYDNLVDAAALARAAASTDEWGLQVLTATRRIAVSSASETVRDDERQGLQTHYLLLVEELNRVARSAEFAGHAYATGQPGRLTFPIGNDPGEDSVTVRLTDLRAGSLGVSPGAIDVNTATGARSAIDAIDAAIAEVSADRAGLEALAEVLQLEAERVLAELE